MKHALDLWSWQGRVTRLQYLIAGACLFAAKYPLDLLVSVKFHHEWNPLMYVSPKVSPLLHAGTSPAYWLTLFAVALPFVAAGVSLSARRLRDMGVHPFWAGLFFLPFFHFAFFLVLAAAPSHREPEPAPTPDAGPFRASAAPPVRLPPPGMRIIPRGAATSLLFGIILSLLLGLGCFVVTVQLNRVLGNGLFVAVPFGMGFLTSFCAAHHPRTKLGWVIGYSLIPIAASLLLLIAMTWEGVACLIMAAPILFGVSIVGAVAGFFAARASVPRLGAAIGVAVVPAFVGADLSRPPSPTPLAVVSTVTIHAPPEVVWRNVVSFPPIDSPPEPIFAITAMPIEARIDGRDPGATRRCIFTNGEFEEPIEVWDEPRQLRFGVRKQPANLDRYIDVERGQFLLIPNADGTTTLRGTTWYRLRVQPASYWENWTHLFLHAIHMRVLDHIQRISENPAAAAAGSPTVQPPWMQAANATCKCTTHASGR